MRLLLFIGVGVILFPVIGVALIVIRQLLYGALVHYELMKDLETDGTQVERKETTE